MSLQEHFSVELKTAMKRRDVIRTQAIRILIGELQRQPQKNLDDAEVIGIIKKLVKSERELLAAKGETVSEFIDILEGYLPQPAGEDEIRAWIGANIDLSGFSNKMQAMKPIMAHFGSSADGAVVKKILQSFDG